MRRVAIVIVLLLLAGLGLSAPASAAPSPKPANGWRTSGDTLTWTSSKAVPMGDAAVEFWAGDQRLGRARSTDQRTFTLTVPPGAELADLQVRAAGRRLDQARPRSVRVDPAPELPPIWPSFPVDPGSPGPYATVAGEYDLPALPFPGYEAPIEMRGLVIAPKGAPGVRPLAVFLHGRHSTCYQGAENASAAWPCPAGWKSIPSYRGYRQAQQLLASQGYITVSISANGVNAQDWVDEDGGAAARSAAVRAHLERWAVWGGRGRPGAPAFIRTLGPADMSKVFLVGHSRGGEGVNRAAMDSIGRSDWTIRGMLLIGPTIFGHNPVPDVPTGTILPGCDGDVSDLQGQMYVDVTRGASQGRALHSSLYVVGANHNFFNTEWTPGQAVAPAWDDFPAEYDDPTCSAGRPVRISALEQQQAGATYIAAAARVFVAGDERVLPLLDGSRVSARSAGEVRVWSHALGGNRTPAVIPDATLAVSGNGRLCKQIDQDPAKYCLPSDGWNVQSPHFVSFYSMPDEPRRYAVRMTWSAAGQSTVMRPATAQPVSGELALRLAVPAGSSGTRLGVVATDSTGRTADLGEVLVNGQPGTTALAAAWAQEVRVPLQGLTSIAQLELIPRNSRGSAYLIDAWGRQAGLPAVDPVALPLLDAGELRVAEGNSGTRQLEVPITYTGSEPAEVEVFLTEASQWETTAFTATVQPGQRTIPAPTTVTGDNLYGYDTQYVVTMKVVRGLVVRDYLGEVVVTDDDPEPTFRIEAVADDVAEGGTLRWVVRMNRVAEVPVYVSGTAVPVSGGRELSTRDVDPDWLWEFAYDTPDPERRLSALPVVPYTEIRVGRVTAELTVPTITDRVTEPAERVTLEVTSSGRTEDTSFIGTVTGVVQAS